MNCDCIEKTEEKFKGILSAKTCPIRPARATFNDAVISGTSLAMTDNELSTVFAIPVRIKWEMPNGSIKKAETSILASYCPFCGQPTSEPEEGATAPDAVQTLFATFDDCLDRRPHLLLEVGYNRIADWGVQVYDATGVGLREATQVVSTQGTRAEAMNQATTKLKELFPDNQ